MHKSRTCSVAALKGGTHSWIRGLLNSYSQLCLDRSHLSHYCKIVTQTATQTSFWSVWFRAISAINSVCKNPGASPQQHCRESGLRLKSNPQGRLRCDPENCWCLIHNVSSLQLRERLLYCSHSSLAGKYNSDDNVKARHKTHKETGELWRIGSPKHWSTAGICAGCLWIETYSSWWEYWKNLLGEDNYKWRDVGKIIMKVWLKANILWQRLNQS